VSCPAQMKYFLTLLWLWSCMANSSRAEVQPAPPDEKLRLATDVQRIFEAKCVDCHGAHLAKPKGKFGYVLDLSRVGKNPKYVVPGDLKESELYQMVLNNEMPGEDADVPPLTPDELKMVARWIMVGAPGDLPANVASAPAVPAAQPQAALITRFFGWLGKFHPASTHFPVALLLAAVLAEGIAWWFQRAEWTLVVRFLVVLGALSAIPTATLGWMVKFPTVEGSSLATVYHVHRILGTITAVWGVVCAVLICMAECQEGSFERRRFRGALLLGALFITVTGLLGGMLTFGVDHYAF
jgi:mono/diheme cytochrome c family protein